MQFDELIQGFKAHPDNEVTVPAEWGQGRATFGGLVGALLYEAMEARCEPGRPLRAMAISFVGPLTPGEPAQVNAEVLRQGKAVSQMEARAVQQDGVKALAIGSFGAGRESKVRVEPEPAPEAPAPDACQKLPYIAGVTPEFTRFIEMRWAFGGLPYSNRPERQMGGWMRFRDLTGPVSPAHLVALIDAWPPALLPHLKSPAPASSLSWTFELMQPQPAFEAEDWLLYRATIDQAADGYGQTSAAIWTAQGELVALSRQTVTVFG